MKSYNMKFRFLHLLYNSNHDKLNMSALKDMYLDNLFESNYKHV